MEPLSANGSDEATLFEPSKTNGDVRQTLMAKSFTDVRKESRTPRRSPTLQGTMMTIGIAAHILDSQVAKQNR